MLVEKKKTFTNTHTVFVTTDGEEFRSKSKANEHQEKLNKKDEYNKIKRNDFEPDFPKGDLSDWFYVENLEQLNTIVEFNADCKNNVFYGTSNYPNFKNIKLPDWVCISYIYNGDARDDEDIYTLTDIENEYQELIKKLKHTNVK